MPLMRITTYLLVMARELSIVHPRLRKFEMSMHQAGLRPARSTCPKCPTSLRVPCAAAHHFTMTKEAGATAQETKEAVNSEAKKDEMNTSKESNDETKDTASTTAQNDGDDVATTTPEAMDESKDTSSNTVTSDKEATSTPSSDSKEKEEANANPGATENKVGTSTGESSNNDSTTTPSKTAAAAATTTTTTTSSENQKVKVHFVAVGAAPIMKKTKFQIGADQRFAAVTSFLRKMLKLTGSGSSLFLYCNSAFVPSPDERVGDLSDCFSIRGELVIHYSLQEAWG